jgi:hypothetical protein
MPNGKTFEAKNQSLPGKIAHRCSKIVSGDFSADDVAMLLNYMRFDYFQNNSAVLWDVASFLAHINLKDRGVAVDVSSAMLGVLVEVSRNGGKFEVKPIYSRSEIFDELLRGLKTVPVYVRRADLFAQENKFFRALSEIMAGVPIRLNVQEVKECKLKMLRDELVLSARSNLPGPIIRANESVEFCFPVFGA